MPLRDRTPRPYRSLPKLGMIQKGTKTEKGFPTDLTYFNLERAPDVARVYGDQPTELLVYLPLPGTEQNFSAYYELGAASGTKCRGDGVQLVSALEPGGIHFVVLDGQVVRPYTEEDGTAYQIGEVVPCSGRTQDLYPRCTDCKAKGTLMLMVRDPADPKQLIGNRWGYYGISFGSLHDIDALEQQLTTYEGMARSLGWTKGLQGMQLILKRAPRQMSYADEKNHKRGTKEDWALQMEIDPAWLAALVEGLERQGRQALEAPGAVAELPAAISVDPASGELVTEGEWVESIPFDPDPEEPCPLDGDLYLSGLSTKQMGQLHQWHITSGAFNHENHYYNRLDAYYPDCRRDLRHIDGLTVGEFNRVIRIPSEEHEA